MTGAIASYELARTVVGATDQSNGWYEGALVVSGGIGVVMAYKGFRVWALVWQTIIKSMLMVILMWGQMKWKPLFVFSRISFKALFPYGTRLLVASLLNTGINNFSNFFK